MVKTFIITFLLLISYSVNAQSNSTIIKSTSNDSTIYTVVDTIATYPGGQGSWLRFFERNFNAQNLLDSVDQTHSYNVVIKFIVTKEGALKNFEAKTKYGNGLEEEVIKVLKQSRNWIPAKKNGVSVNSILTFNQVISF